MQRQALLGGMSWSERASPETGAVDPAQYLTLSSMHVTAPVPGVLYAGTGGGPEKAVKSSITH